ncbi:MAG: pantoate--beta-alanine ligase [Candidatus Omnitrophica bacterium]|nr:pantoate--beta-alanine ligase [Candidatus Omnitrophota bacterium]
MRIIRNIKQMQRISREMKKYGYTIGFVPTMGALHQGHISLIRQARKENNKVVVSIFVNPIQFGPQEDFHKYPRNLKQDAKICKQEGVDIIFYPQAKDMYPKGYRTYVTVEELSDVLCGKFRPGHFKGVATVVTKLFNIVGADCAYFGQKDAQQAIIIKRMSQDLNISIRIKVMPTVRCRDGLAMSSRNKYLNQEERKDATVLYQALCLAKSMVDDGIRNTKTIIAKIQNLISQKKSARVQYISIVDLDNLKPIEEIKSRALLALAVYIGKTRLIDNTIIIPKI